MLATQTQRARDDRAKARFGILPILYSVYFKSVENRPTAGEVV